MPPPPQPSPPIYPLYNTTYTLHRLSPLSSLLPSTLPTHARALHDILAGSTLRGVRIGLATEDLALSRAGALKGVSIRPLRAPDAWAAVHDAGEPDDTVDIGREGEGWGVIIEIVYERAEYTAILLRHINAPTTTNGEGELTHLPLLLTRLPPPLRATLLDFLATRFDTRSSPLHLPSSFLKKVVGGYMDALTREGGDVKGAVRDVVVTLAFGGREGGEGGGLKTIDLTIPRDDIPEFISHGSRTSTNTTNTTTDEHPFWNSLHAYVDKHLALDMHNPQVAVVKIACSAFVIASEGRVKISFPGAGEGEREGAEGVVGGLVSLAGRTG